MKIQNQIVNGRKIEEYKFPGVESLIYIDGKKTLMSFAQAIRFCKGEFDGITWKDMGELTWEDLKKCP